MFCDSELLCHRILCMILTYVGMFFHFKHTTHYKKKHKQKEIWHSFMFLLVDTSTCILKKQNGSNESVNQ